MQLYFRWQLEIIYMHLYLHSIWLSKIREHKRNLWKYYNYQWWKGRRLFCLFLFFSTPPVHFHFSFPGSISPLICHAVLLCSNLINRDKFYGRTINASAGSLVSLPGKLVQNEWHRHLAPMLCYGWHLMVKSTIHAGLIASGGFSVWEYERAPGSVCSSANSSPSFLIARLSEVCFHPNSALCSLISYKGWGDQK